MVAERLKEAQHTLIEYMAEASKLMEGLTRKKNMCRLRAMMIAPEMHKWETSDY